MPRTVRILIQTTIPRRTDDWSVDSLSLMTEHLASLRDADMRFEVTARNRQAGPDGSDPTIAAISRSSFDELWIFGLDNGDDGLTAEECAAIGRFRQEGGGILSTRDHQDMGSSLCTVGGIGAAHHFHHHNPEPDKARHGPDDTETPAISWPNYHSGRNGDFQRIVAAVPDHPLLRGAGSGRIAYFPSHPHEGAVGPPAGDKSASVVACGTSLTTGRRFNLVVAFERSRDDRGNLLGRGVAEIELPSLRRLQLGHRPRGAVVRDGTGGRRHEVRTPGAAGHPTVCPQSGGLAGPGKLTATRAA